MENKKLFYAKLMGEVYRVQKEQGIYKGSDSHIYGLINGIETSIKAEFDELSFISEDEINMVCDVFDPYYKEEKSLEEMPQIKQIEMRLEDKCLHRNKFYSILDYLYLSDRYSIEIKHAKSGIVYAKNEI